MLSTGLFFILLLIYYLLFIQFDFKNQVSNKTDHKLLSKGKPVAGPLLIFWFIISPTYENQPAKTYGSHLLRERCALHPHAFP